MFKLTKFTGEEFYLNPDLIKFVEEGGDTIITLVSGERLLVREEAQEVAAKFMDFRLKPHTPHEK